MSTYRIMIDAKSLGRLDEYVEITKEGATILWDAYQKAHPGGRQTMERRNERGGVCWLSEILDWKTRGFLPADFNWEKYRVQRGNK